jgi:hypothetical protein
MIPSRARLLTEGELGKFPLQAPSLCWFFGFAKLADKFVKLSSLACFSGR